MKKLWVVAAAITLALCVFAVANAENRPAPQSLLLNPQPLPPLQGPPGQTKVVVIKLTKDQLAAVKAAPAGADIVLTKTHLKAIGKVWPEFKGTTAKVVLAHVSPNGQAKLGMTDGGITSIP